MPILHNMSSSFQQQGPATKYIIANVTRPRNKTSASIERVMIQILRLNYDEALSQAATWEGAAYL